MSDMFAIEIADFEILSHHNYFILYYLVIVYSFLFKNSLIDVLYHQNPMVEARL